MAGFWSNWSVGGGVASIPADLRRAVDDYEATFPAAAGSGSGQQEFSECLFAVLRETGRASLALRFGVFADEDYWRPQSFIDGSWSANDGDFGEIDCAALGSSVEELIARAHALVRRGFEGGDRNLVRSPQQVIAQAFEGLSVPPADVSAAQAIQFLRQRLALGAAIDGAGAAFGELDAGLDADDVGDISAPSGVEFARRLAAMDVEIGFRCNGWGVSAARLDDLRVEWAVEPEHNGALAVICELVAAHRIGIADLAEREAMSAAVSEVHAESQKDSAALLFDSVMQRLRASRASLSSSLTPVGSSLGSPLGVGAGGSGAAANDDTNWDDRLSPKTRFVAASSSRLSPMMVVKEFDPGSAIELDLSGDEALLQIALDDYQDRLDGEIVVVDEQERRIAPAFVAPGLWEYHLGASGDLSASVFMVGLQLDGHSHVVEVSARALNGL